MSNSFGDSTAPRRKPHYFAPHLLAIIGVIVAVYLAMRPTPPPLEPAKKPPPSIESVDNDNEAASRRGDSNNTSKDSSSDSDLGTPVIKDVTIRDRDDNVVWSGDVDLTPTIQRIEAGELLEQFRNDGSVFQNRERRLPIKPSGYYHEFVHPTPGLDGPGSQRIVTGQGGEIYYTSDHYQTFKSLR